MFPILSLSILPSTLLDLLSFAAANGTPDSVAELADQAIRTWLASARAAPSAAPVPRGYQWKSLFLPEGTQLRVWSREVGSRYAEVQGDKIIHAGQALSPNQFVSMMDGIPRNAWTEVSLLMPGETAWKPAHVRRHEQHRAERSGHTAQSQPPTLSSPSAPSPAVSGSTMPVELAGAPNQLGQHQAMLVNRNALAQPQRLPRVPPIASQARIHAAQAAQAGEGHWWPGAPERRKLARRAEDAFLD